MVTLRGSGAETSTSDGRVPDANSGQFQAGSEKWLRANASASAVIVPANGSRGQQASAFRDAKDALSPSLCAPARGVAGGGGQSASLSSEALGGLMQTHQR